jgi:hypothetical protein
MHLAPSALAFAGLLVIGQIAAAPQARRAGGVSDLPAGSAFGAAAG